MQFRDFIAPNAILGDLESLTKEKAITEMVDALVRSGIIRAEMRTGVLDALLEREKLGSTGIGQGVAIPHAKHPGIRKVVGLFARSREGVDFDALDGQPVHLFFMLLSNQDAASAHLECLAYISKHLRDKVFCRFLQEARDSAEIAELLRDADEKAMIDT